MRIKLMLPLALLMTLVCFAQDTDLMMTGGIENGRFWHIIHNEGKVAWLMGYHNGLLQAALAAYAFSNPKDTGEEGIKLQARITQINFPSGMAYPEIAKALDRFYDTPENLRIDLRDGLQVVLLRSAGISPSTIEETIAKYRKQAAQR